MDPQKYLDNLKGHKMEVNHTQDKQRGPTQNPSAYLYSILFPDKGIPTFFQIPLNYGVPTTLIQHIEHELEMDKVWEGLEIDLELDGNRPFPNEVIYTNNDGYMVVVEMSWASEKKQDTRNQELIRKIKSSGIDPSTVYVPGMGGPLTKSAKASGNKSYLYIVNVEMLIPSPAFRIQKELNKILDCLLPYINVNDVQQQNSPGAKIHMLVKGDYEMYFKDFDISKFTPKLVNPDVFYGKGFESYNKELLGRVETTKKGVVLFHGDPGTGKTHYIRYLLHELGNLNKRIIYIPPAMVEGMTDPGFITFLTNDIIDEDKDTILLIEDAEPLIESRGTGASRTNGISNLLNSTDGLLNDILGLVVIATFNTDITKIDKALLRPGRLLARKEFKKIKSEDVKELCDILGVKASTKIEKDKDYSVAEIINLAKDKKVLLHDLKEERTSIGFKS